MGGRSVLVTGASSGIGRAAARMLRARGYRVLATARAAGDLADLRSEGYEAIPLELAEPDSVAACAATAAERTGDGPWALFANAGASVPGALEDLPRDALRAQLEVNVVGTVDLVARLLPAMRRAGDGRIVLNGSVLGYVSLPFRGAYTASKHALEAVADTLRLELFGSGVHVSLIQPGPVTSRLRAHAMEAFARHVDADRSPHRDRYARLAVRGAATGPPPFTLPPEAVGEALLRALEARRPRARYRVTLPAHLFWYLRCALPYRALDALLRRLV